MGSLEELSTYLHLLVLPSTLWAIHVDPKHNFIVILHIEVESLTVNIDKAVLLMFNHVNNAIDSKLFIQNKVVDFPRLNQSIKSISDLSYIITFMEGLKLCSNFDNVEYPQCLKYIEACKSKEAYCFLCSADKRCHTESLPTNHHESNFDYSISSLQGNDFISEDIICNTENQIDYKLDMLYPPDDAVLVKPKDNDLICQVCTAEFYNRNSLNEHLQIHNNQKQFVCEICNKVSHQWSAHEKHLSTHENSKSNLCNICGKTFCHGYRMKDHLLTHSSEKPFKCDICGKCFTKKINLTLHQKTHLGIRPFVCSTCGKSYTTQSNLSTHIKSCHTSNKPYMCTNCTKSFVHPRYLRIHMRKHTGEKPYKCFVCSKTFAKNIHLTVHIRTHTGEKPHICSLCNKGFTTTGNLKSHKRIHHKTLEDAQQAFNNLIS